MNKKLLVLVFGILILIGGGFFFLVTQKDETTDTAPNSSAAITRQEDQENLTETQPTAASGSYVAYDESEFASTQGTKVLFFHAPWCPQCRALETSIQQGDIPTNTTIFKVDYDTSQELRKKYGVTIQTTLVKVDDAGNEVAKFVAYGDPSLDALKENLL